jgi:hypothetical protein
MKKITDDILQIPIKISKGHVEIDKKNVAARLSSLLAGKQANKSSQFLSHLVDLVSPSQTAPSPTTSPFPWESIKNQKGEKNEFNK